MTSEIDFFEVFVNVATLPSAKTALRVPTLMGSEGKGGRGGPLSQDVSKEMHNAARRMLGIFISVMALSIED